MPNIFKNETSLYLQQHADNPVDWHPWSEQAFALAEQTNKAILLSIGYSSCHWCHVMAQESFEDKETAELINEHFIAIKVDREERPDIDNIYQNTHQLLNMQAGGWPLTVFLCPETKSPFFSGTYFPKEERFNRPAFKTVLIELAEFYLQNRDKIRASATTIQQQLSNLNKQPRVDSIPNHIDLQKQAIHNLLAQFDSQHGGFSGAPKFPMPNLLLNFFNLSINDLNAEKALLFTLIKMQQGGILDQLGGGFFRYSTDNAWQIPHFEKMLYDNAQLLSVYALAFQKFKKNEFKHLVTRIIGWLKNKMLSDNGSFFASIDADTNHMEGETYVWNIDEIKNILTADEFTIFTKIYGLDNPANFEGKWHLCQQTSQPLSETEQITIDNAQNKLLQKREARKQPTTDLKIICSWNALTAKSLLQAGYWMQKPHDINLGQTCLDFIHTNLWKNNQLFAIFQSGKEKHPAYLDDYAFLLDALLHSLAASWRDQDFIFLQKIADKLISDFYDHEHAGFFFTAHHHESLIARTKPLQDGVTPSGNGVATLALLRTGHLTGNTTYIDAASETLKYSFESIQKNPEYYFHLTQALKELQKPPLQALITGSNEQLIVWKKQSVAQQQSNQFLFFIPTNSQHYPNYLSIDTNSQHVLAYVCQGTHCEQPTSNINSLLEKLL